MRETFLNERVTLYAGDCLAVLPTLAENSVDACVTDPPYELKFMSKAWDGTGIAFRPDVWREVYRVLKPGAHLLAFGGTRTYHRMACAIEDAGFEIRDTIMWHYGSGFPKSHDMSKGINRAAGAAREIIGRSQYANRRIEGSGPNNGDTCYGQFGVGGIETKPATDAASQWEGWGTALKPACEPIVLARKPLSENTIAANVLRWGTGAINVDGCRVVTGDSVKPRGSSGLDTDMNEGWARPWMEDRTEYQRRQDVAIERANTLGRWPANVIHDGSEEVLAGFPESQSGELKPEHQINGGFSHPAAYHAGSAQGGTSYFAANTGSAARFFYTAKADSDDRLGSKHPTVKPLDLMQYLCRLVCRRGGTILDPFSGTGTTGEAAWREGMNAVLIEREAEYQDDIRRRMALALSGPDERARQAIKQRMKGKPMDAGPLFGGAPVDERGGGRKIYGVFADERLARSD